MLNVPVVLSAMFWLEASVLLQWAQELSVLLRRCLIRLAAIVMNTYQLFLRLPTLSTHLRSYFEISGHEKASWPNWWQGMRSRFWHPSRSSWCLVESIPPLHCLTKFQCQPSCKCRLLGGHVTMTWGYWLAQTHHDKNNTGLIVTHKHTAQDSVTSQPCYSPVERNSQGRGA